jgi:hypothetical protein
MAIANAHNVILRHWREAKVRLTVVKSQQVLASSGRSPHQMGIGGGIGEEGHGELIIG